MGTMGRAACVIGTDSKVQGREVEVAPELVSRLGFRSLARRLVPSLSVPGKCYGFLVWCQTGASSGAPGSGLTPSRPPADAGLM